MSKGWESKNVEEQQASAAADAGPRSGAPSAAADEGDRRRRVQDLELQRERILNERTSSPHRRNALSEALATIERDLELLGWSIKL